MLLVLGRRREVDTSIGTGWGYDKAVRSIHEVNCTGSCSPDYEPRGCPQGAALTRCMYSHSDPILTMS